jgi:oligoendopeptidase F
MAPLPAGDESESRVPWEQGKEFVQASFSAVFPELGELAARAFNDLWIDHTPRDGKRPGGFCSSSHLLGQSRIFMTYHGAGGDVQTLAHELGHAYHSFVMRDIRSWGRRYPMPLAETASTFAENLTTTAVLNDPETSSDKKRAILDARLQDAEAFLLNIPMRFDFEHELYTERAKGELSVAQLCDMMTRAQRKNYGDALDPDALNPWFWASKLHFYITGVSFYNFPYTFGYLFSAGLFKRFLDEGKNFLPAYRELLRKTGSASAEEVVMNALGIDLTKPDFWSASIDLIQADFDQYKTL